MFCGYNMKVQESEKIYFYGVSDKRPVRDSCFTLQYYLNNGGYLDGGKIHDDYFPSIESDVLISHSHNDIALARKMANLIEKIGVKVFLDGEYWGSCDDFLRKVDDEYCMNEGNLTYSYEKRNFSTSVMHMLLSTALSHVIQKTECVIFSILKILSCQMNMEMIHRRDHHGFTMSYT